SVHAVASAIATPLIGPVNDKSPLIKPLHDRNKDSLTDKVIPTQLALPRVQNGGARSRFRTEIGQNLHATVFSGMIEPPNDFSPSNSHRNILIYRGALASSPIFCHGVGTREPFRRFVAVNYFAIVS